MATTLELIKELQTTQYIPNTTDLSLHRQKLDRVLNLNTLAPAVFTEEISWCRDNNFRLFVTPDFAFKFKYAASVGYPTPEIGRKFPVGRFSERYFVRKKYHYTGDIPDNILDNMNLFIAHNPDRAITIHSCELIPMTVEVVPRLCDPVAIGWFREICFDNTWLGWRNWGDKNAFGVILGIWDKEKEIKVL